MLTAMGKLMINVFLLDLPEHVYCLAMLFYSLSVLRLKACFFFVYSLVVRFRPWEILRQTVALLVALGSSSCEWSLTVHKPLSGWWFWNFPR